MKKTKIKFLLLGLAFRVAVTLTDESPKLELEKQKTW